MSWRAQHTPRAARLMMVVLFAACGNDDDANGVDAGSDAAVDAGDAIPTFNGCSAADYVDLSAEASRTIVIAGTGLTYTPKCTIIGAGQSVRFEGSLAAHPLAPGNPDDPNAGSADNPITETSSGREVSFSFERAGTYPYYCVLHAFGSGQGMAGSIHVR